MGHWAAAVGDHDTSLGGGGEGGWERQMEEQRQWGRQEQSEGMRDLHDDRKRKWSE